MDSSFTNTNVVTKFVVSNCQKKKSATSLIHKNANIEDSIFALTEPWTGSSNRCTFQSPWRVMTKENNSRAALISPPWADAFMHTKQSDRDSVFCTLNIGGEEVIVGVMYVENGLIDVNKWSNRFNELQAICPKILVFADSNAHSTLWGYKKSDIKGRKWEEFLGLTNLEVFTNSYAVTFKNSRDFSSCIDIAFGTSNLKTLLSDRIMSLFPSASDHLTWGINFNVPLETNAETFWRLKSVDWEKFNAALLVKLGSCPGRDLLVELDVADQIDALTSFFQATMEEIIDKL